MSMKKLQLAKPQRESVGKSTASPYFESCLQSRPSLAKVNPIFPHGKYLSWQAPDIITNSAHKDTGLHAPKNELPAAPYAGAGAWQLLMVDDGLLPCTSPPSLTFKQAAELRKKSLTPHHMQFSITIKQAPMSIQTL